MSKITYRIVEHDGGWAYKLGDVFSETFPTHDLAARAARAVAAEQSVPGEVAYILYQDASGEWREEVARGDDRPSADVVDTSADPFRNG
ncbi:DUF2188 domain-containing protein [Enterovirga aerilata]|uniref:DUF2188 domain-containing protein n=1 Tax=Enterovirga aerilata TaxID=2730920 RepID=A0A849HWL3_9HYPH|nr:DUF2188 domain-containing protein [Enterovirga sp. DB1703]NNM71926.1 DUF2188 domain-containing protein [Enterovirga sp. DB1703]